MVVPDKAAEAVEAMPMAREAVEVAEAVEAQVAEEAKGEVPVWRFSPTRAS